MPPQRASLAQLWLHLSPRGPSLKASGGTPEPHPLIFQKRQLRPRDTGAPTRDQLCGLCEPHHLIHPWGPDGRRDYICFNLPLRGSSSHDIHLHKCSNLEYFLQRSCRKFLPPSISLCTPPAPRQQEAGTGMQLSHKRRSMCLSTCSLFLSRLHSHSRSAFQNPCRPKTLPTQSHSHLHHRLPVSK